MSYRGKKLKRTTLQVMRDISEEYTKEIKKAGGIGCFVKGAEEAARGSPKHYRRRSHYDQHCRCTRFEDYSLNDFEQSRWQENRDLLEDSRRSSGKEKHREENHSGISKRHRSHGRSDERRSYRRERDDAESTRATHYESGS
ncbi:hypothetical protein CRYUN_Cryun09bG0204900 [Craigia yunnanensis]